MFVLRANTTATYNSCARPKEDVFASSTARLAEHAYLAKEAIDTCVY